MPVAEFLEVADGAAVVEFPGASDEGANRAAVALASGLAVASRPGLLDAIPGARTLFLTFDPDRLPAQTLRAETLGRVTDGAAPAAARTVTIEVFYGGEAGPDLEELASRAGLSAEEFARRHASGEYTVGFLGFTPGFAYLVGLAPDLHAPRLPSPRPRLPAGSVAIGGPYTGVYPSATPGGWRLIGRSPAVLFEEQSEPPALLAPGDRVRFVPLTAARFAVLERDAVATSSRSPTHPGGRPVFRVVKPGVFTSVQGAPQFGHGASGLPPGGAFDPVALASGNRRLGNAPAAGALEATLLGPELEALSDVGVCLSGASMTAERNGAPVDTAAPIPLSSGDRLRLLRAGPGARTYLCVEGGIQAPGRLGLTRRIEAGEILMVRPGAGAPAGGALPGDAGAPSHREDAEEAVLRVVLDPRRDRFFAPRAVERFFDTVFRVSSTSDRRGVRLEGDPIEASGDSEMPSEGTALGTIQVPAGGLPILLGPDRPITGGYARMGTVIAADWPRVAQAPPGRKFRFAAVTIAQARAARGGGSGGGE